MKSFLIILFSFVLIQAAGAAEDRTSLNNGELKTYLEKYPASDADGDGLLTDGEYTAYLPQPILDRYGTNGIHRSVEIPLRDGLTVPAEVYLPANGEGPWPVILTRAEYGRWRELDIPVGCGQRGFAYVIHDTREWDRGRHANWIEKESSLNELEDGYDVVEWLAAQPWCNGRIGTVGGSGHGYAAAMMIWSNIPHYTVNGIKNTAGNVKYYWCFHNGVRRGTSYNWIGARGASLISTNLPTLPSVPYDYDAWLTFIRERGRDVQTWYFNNTGWFDPMSEGALDDFAALQHTGRAFVTVEPRCHGGLNGMPGEMKRFPTHGKNAVADAPPSTEDILKGAEAPEGLASTLTYFLMGDVLDPEAPGNHTMITHEWPVPHEPLALYLHAGGSLSTNPPVEVDGSRSYDYNPNHPAPTIGGHHDWGTFSGPWDQRPLRERDDVLYFVTEPLTEPVAITGKLRMNLFFSSDARDTAFVVKVIDIYPDGFEFIVRESAGMGRYHSGYEHPSALENGKIYELDLDLWSTAIVFNKGHRIGLIVTSSSDKSYEIHPNTFEQIAGYSNAPVARNTIYSAPEHASVLILPQVPVP